MIVKLNIRYNPNMLVVRKNGKIKIIYDYIYINFQNLCTQFNLIIQALNTNIDLFSSVMASKEVKVGKKKK